MQGGSPEWFKIHGLVRVFPVLDPSVRGMCRSPYPNHPRGCPNFGKRKSCPPKAPLFSKAYDMAKPVYAVVNEFPLGAHIERMRKAHPNWTDRQLRCCLYWQGTARKRLYDLIGEAMGYMSAGYRWTTCPEAMGVNVTETLRLAGIILEWPPENIARQVALIAHKKG